MIILLGHLTIETVKSLNIRSVMGNHDRDSATGEPVGYNVYAGASYNWTHNQLSQTEHRYLLDLPRSLMLSIERAKLFICHGSPNDLVDEYVFPPPTTSLNILESYLQETQADVAVLGHTHIPFFQRLTKGYAVNPSSVGQPRSGDPRASYAIMTIEGKEARFDHRLVEYDVEKVAERIVEVGLSPSLAQRLYRGI